jgi:AraC-like DNA-binding protein
MLDLIVIHSNQKQDKQGVILKEEDLKKIIYARQLVERDLQKPSSLIELSRKAGINDFKLKKGFKALTGHTVFGYLYKIRMEKAHYYLAKEKRTVNEVAFLVGYKNAQHFIAAFKKQYEILPGSLNKN